MNGSRRPTIASPPTQHSLMYCYRGRLGTLATNDSSYGTPVSLGRHVHPQGYGGQPSQAITTEGCLPAAARLRESRPEGERNRIHTSRRCQNPREHLSPSSARRFPCPF